MTPEEALARFLSRAVMKTWRERYLSLIRTKRGKKTFLADLFHTLGDRLEESRAAPELPGSAWSLPAYSFSELRFGEEHRSLEAALDSVGDGSLVIDTNGDFGIYQPETFGNQMKCFILR